MLKISVIIPVYNTANYLRKCLESITNQTLREIEIICINDGSTDNSINILKEYKQNDSRIIIIDKKNEGVSVARNNGLEIARGEYIYFIDSDDYLELNGLEALYNKITKENTDIICFGHFEVANTNILPAWNTSLLEKCSQDKNVSLNLLKDLQYFIWDKLYKREFLQKNNIKFPVGIETAEDNIFNYFCLFNNPEYSFFEPNLYYYTVDRKESVTNNRKNLVKKDFIAFKYLVNQIEFKKAEDKYKIVCIENFINAIRSKYSNIKNRKYIITYLKDVELFKEYLKETFDKEFLGSVSNYNELKKCSLKKIILENIFSLKNETSCNKKRKVITILGCKIKIKKGYSKDLNKLYKNKIKNNSVILLEANTCHGETISGYLKYLHDLGYSTDIIVTPKIYQENPFIRIEPTLYNNIYKLDSQDLAHFLKSDKITKYKFAILNSYHLYYNFMTQKTPMPFFEFFKNAKQPKNGYLAVTHHLEYIDKNLLKENRLIQLPDFKSDTQQPVFCNPNYFGEISKHNKNEITNFITIGELSIKRKNCNLLINAIKELHTNGIKNFKVTVIGQGSLDKIPHEICNYLDIKGRLDFDEMFNLLEKADFFLTLLDPDNIGHDRYIQHGTSGAFQLIYGFNKPCVIAKKFASCHYFNDENAMIYNENSDFTNSLKDCINITEKNYELMCKNLNKTTQIIRNKSQNNLKSMLDKL